jgi:hypothetical protein
MFINTPIYTYTGKCTVNSLDPNWKAANMPFCSNAISFPVCVPAYQVYKYLFMYMLCIMHKYDCYI